ncbi:MAG: hypothetical protein VKN72_28665, partial [Nostocales cyanobacterium 94392]|nr:hypothetical protein [Nostocales cyanobacterium 94392]
GAAYYLLKTKDKEFNKELTEHLKTKDPRLCLDGCNYTPSLGDILARSGIKTFKKMPNEAIGAYLLTEARSAPIGYQLRLIADKYVFYKLTGLDLTNAIPRTLYDRQSCNSYFRYLAHGSYSLKNLDVKPVKLYNYRWSQACDRMDVRLSNLWSEIYLLQISIKGIR